MQSEIFAQTAIAERSCGTWTTTIGLVLLLRCKPQFSTSLCCTFQPHVLESSWTIYWKGREETPADDPAKSTPVSQMSTLYGRTDEIPMQTDRWLQFITSWSETGASVSPGLVILAGE